MSMKMLYLKSRKFLFAYDCTGNVLEKKQMIFAALDVGLMYSFYA